MNEHIANQCETERYMRFSSSYACLIIVSLTVIPKHLSEKCSKKYSNFCIEQNFKKLDRLRSSVKLSCNQL
ncbi:hypothetical protein, partial [Faecalibaculum rodentium]|uniref:hypothetical protein n=1 Tax=Faecalibaculum rodentium TaxID=1702221 RepID=UPI0027304C87